MCATDLHAIRSVPGINGPKDVDSAYLHNILHWLGKSGVLDYIMTEAAHATTYDSPHLQSSTQRLASLRGHKWLSKHTPPSPNPRPQPPQLNNTQILHYSQRDYTAATILSLGFKICYRKVHNTILPLANKNSLRLLPTYPTEDKFARWTLALSLLNGDRILAVQARTWLDVPQ
ncbi:hypothetical protein E2C01_001964 [Portunus trituberculatus]|uniref:Uncharacterized protein n=1 Tax=Portunus trituberculatus TaxID=210409 RepID=A0A5B7CLS3_PORTR|nr:hypothetical protein [Portunus trituberculatus]